MTKTGTEPKKATSKNVVRKNVLEAAPVLALVGATDLAFARVRQVAADAEARRSALREQVEHRVTQVQTGVEHAVANLDPDYLQKVARSAAGRVDSELENLVERGRAVLDRIEDQQPTQELIRQGRSSIGRGRAAITTAQRAVEGTVGDLRNTLRIGRTEVEAVAEQVADEAEAAATEIAETAKTAEVKVRKTVTEGTRGTQAAVQRTTVNARKRVDASESSAKGAVTSARRTAKKAGTAAAAAADTLGE